MKSRHFSLRAALILGAALPALADPPLHELSRDDFTAGMSQWVAEVMPGGTVAVRDGALRIDTDKGCTVWFRHPLHAPVVITYEVTPLPRAPGSGLAFRSEPAHAGPISPVSDVNCFWMAQDLRSPDNLFAPGLRRTGLLSDYDGLRTYYVGFGSNNNTTTRFRRYAGDGTRPLLPGYDLTDPRFLLQPGRTYRIRLVAREGAAEFWRDGERVFRYRDSAPLTFGWFGFRTVHSRLVIRRFRVEGE